MRIISVVADRLHAGQYRAVVEAIATPAQLACLQAHPAAVGKVIYNAHTQRLVFSVQADGHPAAVARVKGLLRWADEEGIAPVRLSATVESFLLSALQGGR